MIRIYSQFLNILADEFNSVYVHLSLMRHPSTSSGCIIMFPLLFQISAFVLLYSFYLIHAAHEMYIFLTLCFIQELCSVENVRKHVQL